MSYLKIIFTTLLDKADLDEIPNESEQDYQKRLADRRKEFIKYGAEVSTEAGRPIGVQCTLGRESIKTHPVRKVKWECVEEPRVAYVNLWFLKLPITYMSKRKVFTTVEEEAKIFSTKVINSSIVLLSDGDTFNILTGKIQALKNLIERVNLLERIRLNEEELLFLQEALTKYQLKLEAYLTKIGRFIVIDTTCNESRNFNTIEAAREYLNNNIVIDETAMDSTLVVAQKEAELKKYTCFQNTEYGRQRIINLFE